MPNEFPPIRAKIAATLGPSCDAPGVLEAMLEGGVRIARLNFSHGEADDHRRRVVSLRRASKRTGIEVALMADLQGPRFRVGRFPGGSIELVSGGAVELEAGRAVGREGRIPVGFAQLPRSVSPGDRILLDDGKLELRVSKVREKIVVCDVVRGGILGDRKGINLPDSAITVPALTTKDRADLKLAVGLGADWLAVSFVRGPEDVETARRLLRKEGAEIPVLAKIERPEALDRLEEILAAADGLLVARGDLGVELPPERVPILQKRIIERANAVGKPVMTATQMLDSMRHAERPTRAEASDVANAVLDGTGSLLLTAETAVGRHPVEAIRMMARIIREAEATGRVRRAPLPDQGLSVPEATSLAAARTAYDVGARCIATFTVGGGTPAHVARFRPSTPIVAFTTTVGMQRRLALYWGVEPRRTTRKSGTRDLVKHVERALVREGRVSDGERIVVLSGFPVGLTGTTNLVTVHTVGSATEPSSPAKGRRASRPRRVRRRRRKPVA